MLDYLVFDRSDDDQGIVNWDAMACVAASRVPALQAELQQVLQWACTRFVGRHGPVDEGGDWDVDLQAQDDTGDPLPLSWDPRTGAVQLSAAGHGRTTLSISLSGTPQFADAFDAQWGAD